MSFVLMVRRAFPPLLKLALIAGLLALCGCPPGKPAGGGGAGQGAQAPPPDDAEAVYQAGIALSLLKDTPLVKDPPDAIGFSQDGTHLYTRGISTADNLVFILPFEVSSAGLVPGNFQISDPQYQVPQIAVSPNGAEALVQSQWQPGGKLVRDLIWRVSGVFPPEYQNVSGVPYDRSSGLPASGPVDTFMDLKPFYSSDGQTVVVPLNNLGLCVVDVQSGVGAYVEYPKLPFTKAGMALGPLPDANGKRYAYASFWLPGLESDQCEVYVLDLDARSWEKVFSLSWIAKSFGVKSVFDDPWLVSGTRPSGEQIGDGASHAPQDQQQGRRVPRVALVVPRAGTPQLLEIWGNPANEVAVEPHGACFAYMDRNRSAMLRVDPAKGDIDIDNRWFSNDPDIKTFVSAEGAHVYFWKRDILIEAEWKKHEKQRGYAAGGN